MRSGGCPAGSGRALRLDPFALPVRFAASDAAADGRVREVELHRERVVVRRSLAGMRMALNMPVAAFAGVGLRLDGAATCRRRAGAQGSRPRAAAVSVRGSRRGDGRMAQLGRRARACPCWSRTKTAGASRSRGWARCASSAVRAAPPPPQRLEAPPAVHSAAPRPRQVQRGDAGPSRRARDHREELGSTCTVAASACRRCICISMWSASTWRSV